jgi:tetratricopeptide (TPR) repeat protein
LLNWGLIYYYQKKYPQALTYFSILKKHEEPGLYYFKALSEYRMRQPAEALKSINQAIALIDADDEENAPYFYDRAIIKQVLSQQTNKPSDAVNDFFQAVYLVPEIVDQRDYNGDTLELLGSAKHVLKGTYTTQQLDSVRVVGYQQRAEAFADLEQLSNALEEVEKAVQIDSLNGYSYYLRGSYRATSNQYAPAIHDFDKALRLPYNPVEDQTYYMRGLTYAGMELYQKAIADFTQAIALNGQNADFYFDRSYAYADLGDFSNAIQDVSKAIELDPSENEYRVSRAGFYIESDQFDLALEDCDQVLSIENSNADAYYYRGTAYEGKKNYAMAIQAYTQALALNPELTEAKESLDEVMIKAGK